MIFLNGVEVVPTKFPDGTSQVWKLDLDYIKTPTVDVSWYYENEAELIHINQLLVLLKSQKIPVRTLHVPYIPYGRQDKEVSNTTTFAKSVFLDMLMVDNVRILTTDDEHSSDPSSRWMSIYPKQSIEMAILKFDINSILVFPDKGASERYNTSNFLDRHKVVIMDKVRNQLTGNIEGLSISPESTFNFGNQYIKSDLPYFLIIDDICDGGRTFIETAKVIKENCPVSEIGLYTTHGIYSKGLDVLFNSGISKIYTTDSLSYFRKNSTHDFSKLHIV